MLLSFYLLLHNRLKDDCVSVLENSTIKSIADKLKRTAAQIILRYLMQRNLVVIPKSVTPARIKSNYDVNLLNIRYFSEAAKYRF